MADIQSMFYQVRVTPDQCDMLRYLWWPNGDLDKDPVEYRMLVHLFGATSSPSCSNYALKRTAKDNQECTREEIVDAIQNYFYVDDFLKSVSTPDEGIILAKEMRQVLTKGGFKLTKWSSNSREVLDSIPKEDCAAEIKDLDLKKGKPSYGARSWCKMGSRKLSARLQTQRNVQEGYSKKYPVSNELSLRSLWNCSTIRSEGKNHSPGVMSSQTGLGPVNS